MTNEAVAGDDPRIGDQWWRLNNLYWITDERGRRMLFQPNRAQVEMLRGMWFLNIILKARQLGFSTLIQIFMLDVCLFNSNTRCGVIAQDQDTAKAIFRDKIKYAYDQLPEWLQALRPATKCDAGELLLANNSGVRVGTSLRGGTFQYLHVSELGKIARKFPERAEEIQTGSLNTVHAGQFVFVESTAEGRDGFFWELCDRALKAQEKMEVLTEMDFKLHFFAWWRDRRYVLDPRNIKLTADEKRYYARVEQETNHTLTPGQKAWHAKKWRIQQDKMFQEYPSTAREAFWVSQRGAIFGRQMAAARKEKRITAVPWEPSLPVNTFWDFGRRHLMVIWFHQQWGGQHRFIDYYSMHLESMDHYAGVLQGKPYQYGRHYLPHDAEVTDLSRADRKPRAGVLYDLGVKPQTVVPRIPDIGEGIHMVQQALQTCWFDEENCDEGIRGLEAYQYEWNEKLGAFSTHPLGNWASDVADAFRQHAQGYTAPRAPRKDKRKGSFRTA